MTKRQDIQQMLDRFLDGTTTEQEERQLTNFFSAAADVPEDWRAYAILFKGFQQSSDTDSHAKILPLKRWLSIAASLLIILGLSWYQFALKPTMPTAPTDTESKGLTQSVEAAISEDMSHTKDQPVAEKSLAQMQPRSSIKKTKAKAAELSSEELTTAAVADEDVPQDAVLIDIDIEAVQQRGQDLRMAMAAMNDELFETD